MNMVVHADADHSAAAIAMANEQRVAGSDIPAGCSRTKRAAVSEGMMGMQSSMIYPAE